MNSSRVGETIRRMYVDDLGFKHAGHEPTGMRRAAVISKCDGASSVYDACRVHMCPLFL